MLHIVVCCWMIDCSCFLVGMPIVVYCGLLYYKMIYDIRQAHANSWVGLDGSYFLLVNSM